MNNQIEVITKEGVSLVDLNLQDIVGYTEKYGSLLITSVDGMMSDKDRIVAILIGDKK
tara:strand:- start:41 stop:214 length:174 start_codon:yes stop_codon:yes gene_type:complete